MISPLEIMRNSILCHEGKIKRVKAVSELILFEDSKAWIGGSMINGEPVSEKWLVELGFRQETGNIWGNGKLVISVYGNAFKFMDSNLTYEYVHQLQGLYFYIVGEHLKLPKIK